MKRSIVILHILSILLICSDNIIIFRILKNNSNYIKDKIGSVIFLRNLTSTVIRDIDYRKPELSINDDCHENNEMRKDVIDIIGEKRFRQQAIFFDHYRNNSSKLSNTILLGDLIHEFMEFKIDTLLLPFFNTSQYCYNIMETQWCQYQSINLFVFPINVQLLNYNPELSYEQYHIFNRSRKLIFCGKDGVIFNLLVDQENESKQNYYLYIHDNQAFVSKMILNQSM